MRTAPPGRLCSLPPKLRLGLLWLLSRPGGARAAAECSLVRQISSEGGREGHQGGDCVYGVTYGCHGGVVWVATGCQAVVSCAGSGHVRCLSRWSSNVTCPCSATRDTAMQRVRARQSSTWPGAREWTRSCSAPRRDRSGGSRRKMRPPLSAEASRTAARLAEAEADEAEARALVVALGDLARRAPRGTHLRLAPCPGTSTPSVPGRGRRPTSCPRCWTGLLGGSTCSCRPAASQRT